LSEILSVHPGNQHADIKSAAFSRWPGAGELSGPKDVPA
jgi:hypothetical protein